MEEIERDPIKTAVDGMLKTDILLEFVEEMELPLPDILEGVRRAGNKVISNQDEVLQDEDFRMLVMSLCVEISAVLIGDRAEPKEVRLIVDKIIKHHQAESVEAETDTYQ